MEALSEREFQLQAKPMLRKIFIADDPYNESFAEGIQNRKILFEHCSYEMKPPLLTAIISAASARAEIGFFVSILDRPSEDKQHQPYHWYIPFSEIHTYHSLVGPLQNVAYSPAGSWGMMFSDEDHSLFGGLPDIIDTVQQMVPNLDRQVLDFLKAWEDYSYHYGSNVEWIPRLLNHVYGEEQAAELLHSWKPNPASLSPKD